MNAQSPDSRAGTRKKLGTALRNAIRNDSESNRRNLADSIVEFRRTFLNKHGEPDLTGRTGDYKREFAELRDGLSADGETVRTLMNGVRWYTSDAVRGAIADIAGGDENRYLQLCQEYGIKAQTAPARHKQGTRLRRGLEGGNVRSETILALMEAARDRMLRDVERAEAGDYRPTVDMTPDVVTQMVDVAEELTALLPRVVHVWRSAK